MDFNAIFPPEFPQIFLLELLLGIGFNSLVGWAHQHNLWHVSVSVIFGVAFTLIVPAVFLRHIEVVFWQSSILYFICFTASGVPMVIGSTKRTVKESHHRRPLSNSAMRLRDNAVMEIKSLLHELVDNKAEVASLVHRLHELIGLLKSM